MPATNLKRVQILFGIIASLLSPFLLYISILNIDLPSEAAISLRYGAPLTLLTLACAIICLAYAIKGWIGFIASLSTVLSLFAISLSALWSTGISDVFIIGGLIPWSDANAYYQNANLLLQGSSFIPSDYLQRPLPSGTLATLLWLSQENLQVALALLVGIVAISCFLVGYTIRSTLGSLAAALVVLCLFLFYRSYAGSTMTENLGLALGAVGFALLWLSAVRLRSQLALLGLFLIGLGLNARMGTVLVLPTILIWGTFQFRRSKHVSVRFFLGGSGAIIFAFLINSTLLKILGTPAELPFANFPYTLYGVITQTNWFQIFHDHPDLNLAEVASAKQAKQVYGIVFQMIQENPWSIVTGSAKAWKDLFFSSHFLYLNQSFIPLEDMNHWNKVETVLKALSLIGLLACLRTLKSPVSLLVLTYFVGFFASMPIVPIWDAGIRPYAATIIILHVLTAIGLVFLGKTIVRLIMRLSVNKLLQRRLPQFFISSRQVFQSSPLNVYFLVSFSIFLIFISCPMPVALKQFSHPSVQTNSAVCPPGQETGYFRLTPGSYINLVKNKSLKDTHLPNVRIVDFRRGLTRVAPSFEIEAARLKTLSASRSILDITHELLIAKTSIVPKVSGQVVACGRRETARFLTIFHANSIHPIPKN